MKEIPYGTKLPVTFSSEKLSIIREHAKKGLPVLVLHIRLLSLPLIKKTLQPLQRLQGVQYAQSVFV